MNIDEEAKELAEFLDKLEENMVSGRDVSRAVGKLYYNKMSDKEKYHSMQVEAAKQSVDMIKKASESVIAEYMQRIQELEALNEKQVGIIANLEMQAKSDEPAGLGTLEDNIESIFKDAVRSRVFFYKRGIFEYQVELKIL